MVAKSKSNKIEITRIYDAPVKLVWEAWTDPKQVAQWWGPRGFTLTTHSKELKPGGTWVYTMHGPDGTDYPNRTIYYEVEKYSRLVYDHGSNEDHPALFRVSVQFIDLKGKTKMEMTMTLPTPEEAEETKKFIKKAGGNSTWDRLAEYLDKNSSGKERFVINRSFEANVKKIFQLWTEPEHLSRWLPPQGATMKFISADIRPGGKSFYKMEGAYGVMYGQANYIEIQPHHRLIYTQQFCDENGKISRHPLASTWPESMLTVVTFSEEGPDQTRVTVCWEPQEPLTKEELDAFIQARSGMTMGWTGSFDKLDEIIIA